MNEAHKQLADQITKAIEDFEKDYSVLVVELGLRRDGPSGNHRIWNIYIPIVPR